MGVLFTEQKKSPLAEALIRDGGMGSAFLFPPLPIRAEIPPVGVVGPQDSLGEFLGEKSCKNVLFPIFFQYLM